MVRRPLIRVPLPDAPGRSAIHDAAARRHGGATGARPIALILIHGVTVTIHLTHLRAILIVTYGFLVVLVALELRRLDRYVTRSHGALPANLVTLVGLPTLSVLLFWAFFFLDHHVH